MCVPHAGSATPPEDRSVCVAHNPAMAHRPRSPLPFAVLFLLAVIVVVVLLSLR